MPKNPSEVARLYDELEYWKSKVSNHSLSKSAKEQALREVRRLERLLEIEPTKYNGSN